MAALPARRPSPPRPDRSVSWEIGEQWYVLLVEPLHCTWGMDMVDEGSFKQPFSFSRDERAAADPANLHLGSGDADILPQTG